MNASALPNTVRSRLSESVCCAAKHSQLKACHPYALKPGDKLLPPQEKTGRTWDEELWDTKPQQLGGRWQGGWRLWSREGPATASQVSHLSGSSLALQGFGTGQAGSHLAAHLLPPTYLGQLLTSLIPTTGPADKNR